MENRYNSDPLGNVLVSLGDPQAVTIATQRGVRSFVEPWLSRNGTSPMATGHQITGAVTSALNRLLPHRIMLSPEVAAQWSLYYLKVHGIEADFTKLEVPLPPPYLSRLVVVHADLAASCNRCADGIGKNLGERWWQFQRDLDRDTVSERLGTYGTWIIDVRCVPQVADYPRLSSLFFQNRGIPTVSLIEAMINSHMSYWEAGEFVEPGKKIVCSGTRCKNGGVRTVCYEPMMDRLQVVEWPPDYPVESMVYRAVVLN